MTDKIQAIRGMNDILPEETYHWQHVEHLLSRCLSQYGYQEMRLPYLENTQLFKRSIGEVTDIVEKEMYTFQDLNGESVSLRPEGTAGCVRACLEHGLLHNKQQKLWYLGPMFRHEKPQKGRYRQFNQLGVEVLGIDGVAIELELIALCKRFWITLGIEEALTLEINTIGTLQERHDYRDVLVKYLQKHIDELDEDSKRRLDRNPLRILDSKNPNLKSIIAAAPRLMDVISEESKTHFQALCDGLTALGIQYAINPLLVRGLDYYGHTVFEWSTDKLGAQATLCAGGRYDALVEQIGGQPTAAVGFALGIERLLLLRETLGIQDVNLQSTAVFFIAEGSVAVTRALQLAESLRNALPSITVLVNTTESSFKSQFKRADKSGAQLALILGEEEIMAQTIGIKHLRETIDQEKIAQTDLNEYIQHYLQ